MSSEESESAREDGVQVYVVEMRMLRWMCGVTKPDGIRATTKVGEISKTKKVQEAG